MLVLEDRAWVYGQMQHFIACEEVISRLERNIKKSGRAEHSRRRFVDRFRQSILGRVRRPRLHVVCNECYKIMAEGHTYFHCTTRNDGDCNLCRSCVDQLRQCSGLEQEHPLDPRVVDNARSLKRRWFDDSR